MKTLCVLGSLLMIAACAPQPSAPVATAPPPAAPLAAGPPPAAPPPPISPTRVSFDGAYAGSLTLSASGMSTYNASRSGCVSQRPATMTIRNGNVFIEYANWKRHKLHYRGRVDANGVVTAYHKNSDGSSSILSGQIGNNELTGNMTRGPCDYAVTLARR